MKKNLMLILFVGAAILWGSAIACADSLDPVGKRGGHHGPPKRPKGNIQVPEPGTLALIGIGLGGLGAYKLVKEYKK